MCELINRSVRLVNAMECIKGDQTRMCRLANILYYCEDQLGQDIELWLIFMSETNTPNNHS